MRLLVRASGQLSRSDLVRELKDAVARAVRRAGFEGSPSRLWDDRWWCATVASGRGIEAVRRHIEGLSAASAVQVAEAAVGKGCQALKDDHHA